MYNFDGRVNNGSKHNVTLCNEAKSPLNCLNVYSNKYGYCIYTNEIDEKTNEIPMIEEIIKGLNLKGIIVTWDVLNTQTKNKKALLNLEIIYKFVLACLERVKGRYNKSLRHIRKHLSNNFEDFLPELVAYLLVN